MKKNKVDRRPEFVKAIRKERITHDNTLVVKSSPHTKMFTSNYRLTIFYKPICQF
jgi:hypothetical protein